MNPDQKIVDAICREIERVQGLHDAAMYEEGDAALYAALQWIGEGVGLKKALCVLMGWPMEEAAKDGKADQYAEKWADEWLGLPVRPDEEPT